MGGAGDGVVKVYSKLEEATRPYVDSGLVGGKRLWAEGGEEVLAIGFLVCWCMTLLGCRCGKERGGWRGSMGTH